MENVEELFEQYDVDGSGTIDFEEFKEMLPALGIEINEAKAMRFFRRFDDDDSGEITFDEFQVSFCLA